MGRSSLSSTRLGVREKSSPITGESGYPLGIRRSAFNGLVCGREVALVRSLLELLHRALDTIIDVLADPVLVPRVRPPRMDDSQVGNIPLPPARPDAAGRVYRDDP